MNLIVDIGNTRCKFYVVERGRVVARRTAAEPTTAQLEELLAAWPVRRAILSSTRGGRSAIAEILRERVAFFVEFTPQTPVPIVNGYRTPETLGRDRLAAAVGAATLFPGRNVLVVDFGTAVTIDLVTADGTYCGGCISPGMSLRFRSLHEHTASLPLCGPSDEVRLSGGTTGEAIVHGVMNSLAFEIEGYIARLEAELDDLCVIFTGGDAKYFAKRIKNTIFADCNPVVCGLDRILDYNAREESLD